jgi:hypothetical protein
VVGIGWGMYGGLSVSVNQQEIGSHSVFTAILIRKMFA